MFLVEKFSKLLEFTTRQKLGRAEKRNHKATKRLRNAQRNLETTNMEYRTSQAGILIQLTRLNKVQVEMEEKRVLNENKNAKLKELISNDFSD